MVLDAQEPCYWLWHFSPVVLLSRIFLRVSQDVPVTRDHRIVRIQIAVVGHDTWREQTKYMTKFLTSLKASKDAQCSRILCGCEIVLYKNINDVSLFEIMRSQIKKKKKIVRLAFNIQVGGRCVLIRRLSHYLLLQCRRNMPIVSIFSARVLHYTQPLLM